MNKLLSGLMATALAASFAIAAPMPANSAPVFVPKSEQVRTDVQTVESNRSWRKNWRRAHRWERRHAWRADRGYHRNQYHRDRYYGGDPYYGNNGFYGNYGFGHRRHWRNHRGYWRDSGGVRLEFFF